jgi:parvulin-like peptidyl-prolyl isomerase
MASTRMQARTPQPCVRFTVAAVLGIGVLASAGCAADGGRAGNAPLRQSTTTAPAAPASASPADALAVYSGGTVTLADLRAPLFEAAGGQVLSEWLLQRLIDRRLAERGLADAVNDAALARERAHMLATLDTDPDQAQRILDQIRRRRGLGRQRFDSMLRRNAGLRRLVADQVEVTDVAVEQAYQLRHGPRYEARLITTAGFAQAVQLVRQARQGAPFADLAAEHSTDVSRLQGGLLGPVSAADPTYPLALRTTLAQLQPGQVSDPVALDEGFAVLRLERTIPADAVQLEAVRDELSRQVRRQVEAVLMQQLARDLLAEAQVLVLDPTLQRSWEDHRRADTPP